MLHIFYEVTVTVTVSKYADVSNYIISQLNGKKVQNTNLH